MSCTPSKLATFSALLSVFLLLLVTATVVSAQTFDSLLSFDETDGANPYYVFLVQGADGQLYGTTPGGGADGGGTVFKITTSGKFTTIYNFCSVANCDDGYGPVGGLVLGTDGNFYGTTANGGTGVSNGGGGTVFKLTPSGTLTTLYNFCSQENCPDGYEPYVGLVQASNGILYGTTSLGGAADFGTAFSITTTGKFTSLWSFLSAGSGGFPDSGLVQGANGNLYGVTYYGGGTVYEITTAGKLTTLFQFNGANGDGPTGTLFLASNGTFYGTTSAGGANGSGTIFSMTAAGKVTTNLYNFCALTNCADGGTPWAGLIQASDGNLYGVTSADGANGGGTVFQFSPTTKVLTTLYSFCAQTDCTDGWTPYEGLLQDTNGTFYGTTNIGGAEGDGTVYSLSTGLGPFVLSKPGAGRVATKVTILGTSLTGTTAVSFSGTSATFTVNRTGTSISTTVPAGATTGDVKVTTPSGTLASTVAFKVTPQLTTFSPPSGTVGTMVTITGVSLTQTSKVTFGGVSASFTVNSDTQVTATVPTGAKAGKIVITTPGGTASSATSFTVTT